MNRILKLGGSNYAHITATRKSMINANCKKFDSNIVVAKLSLRLVQDNGRVREIYYWIYMKCPIKGKKSRTGGKSLHIELLYFEICSIRENKKGTY
jgi:hypothetical protein